MKRKKTDNLYIEKIKNSEEFFANKINEDVLEQKIREYMGDDGVPMYNQGEPNWEENNQGASFEVELGQTRNPKVELQSPPASQAPDPFDPARFRINQNLQMAGGVKKLLSTIPVRKPSKEWFVRCHTDPNYQIQTLLLELKEDGETYLVDPSLWEDLASEATCAPKILIPTVNRQGTIFLWPIRLPGSDGKTDNWSRSAMDAATHAMKGWIRIQANMSLGAYEIFTASIAQPAPEWHLPPLNELLRLAFRDHFIQSLDHPVLKRLRGEI